MRRYWENEQTFTQPSESLLKKNSWESVKKQKEKGHTQKAGGDRHGVITWSIMPILPTDWTGANVMSVQAPLLI